MIFIRYPDPAASATASANPRPAASTKDDDTEGRAFFFSPYPAITKLYDLNKNNSFMLRIDNEGSLLE